MTRIVAGTAGGLRLRVPKQGTRPTAERVREALFNALEAAGELDGVRVLDLYAGSGALGLEALSRGATDAWFVEADRHAAEVLQANVDAVGLGGTVRHSRVEPVLVRQPPVLFDLVLADPPYDVGAGELHDALFLLSAWLNPGALVVIERPSHGEDLEWPDGYRALRSRRYGDTALHRAEYEGVVPD